MCGYFSSNRFYFFQAWILFSIIVDRAIFCYLTQDITFESTISRFYENIGWLVLIYEMDKSEIKTQKLDLRFIRSSNDKRLQRSGTIFAPNQVEFLFFQNPPRPTIIYILCEIADKSVLVHWLYDTLNSIRHNNFTSFCGDTYNLILTDI